MKTIKIFNLSILFLLFSTSVAVAQNDFGIHVGIASPLSDFGSQDINNEKAGGAGTGFNFGLKYTYELSDNGLGLFAGIDFNNNGLTKGYKSDIEKAFEDIGLLGADYTYFKYSNIPISVGLCYTYEANEKVSLFGNAGLSLNLLKVSDFVVEGSGLKVTTEFDLASSIGFRVGGGILINKKVPIAIDYFGLGSHSINSTARVDGVLPEEVNFELNVSLLTISVGYNF